MSIEPPRYGPWHEWFAWHPVRTDWHGWRWLTHVERRFWRGWHHGQTPTGWDYRPIKDNHEPEKGLNNDCRTKCKTISTHGN